MTQQGFGPPGPHAPGHPPADAPAAHLRAPRHRPWSTVVLVVHALGTALGVVLTGGGVALVVAGAAPRPPSDGIYEPWEIFFGGLLVIVGLAVLVVSVVLTVVTARGRRAADRGRAGLLTGAAIAVISLGGLGVLGSLTAGDPLAVVTLALPPALYALLGMALLRRLRSNPPPPVSDGSSSLTAWH